MTVVHPLPVVVSVPHGGSLTPPEVRGRTQLTARDIFHDGDALTSHIYDATGQVAHCEIARVARALIDLNRAPEDRAPANPDGAIKSVTAYGAPVWAPDCEPDEQLAETLLSRYHAPYHAALTTACAERDPGLLCGLDCHSMAAAAPPTAADAGSARPLFCVSNAHGTTAPNELLHCLGDAIAEAFGVPRDQVLENRPFQGGLIVRLHGHRPLPWMQVEMNRSLYLAEPWFDQSALEVAPRRLEELNGLFLSALELFATQALAD